MKRIIIHWTGGIGKPNKLEKEHYHYLVDNEGVVHEGVYKPIDNENCQDGKYAMHTGGGNTGSIGVALCGMWTNGVESLKESRYQFTKQQCENMFKFVADLCYKYGFKVDTTTVMTHHEFGKNHPSTASKGKPDITYMKPYEWIEPERMGNFIRAKIRWYLEQINKQK